MIYDSRTEAAIPKSVRVYIWLRSSAVNLLDVILNVLALLWAAPLVLYEIFRMCYSYDIGSLIWCSLALMVSFMAAIVADYSRLSVALEAIIETLEKMKPLSVQSLSLTDILPDHALRAYRSWSTNANISIFRVSKVDAPGITYGLSAYNLQHYGTIIFIPYNNIEINFLKRFWILHELGHAEIHSGSRLAKASRMRWSLAVSLIWILFTVDWVRAFNNGKNIAAVSAVCLIGYIKWQVDRSHEAKEVEDEVLADGFALLVCCQHDPEAMRKHPEAEVVRVNGVVKEFKRRLSLNARAFLPVDRRLTDEGNQRRLDRFMRAIHRMREKPGALPDVPLVLMPRPSVMLIVVVLSAVASSLPQISISSSMACLFVGVFLLLLAWETFILMGRASVRHSIVRKTLGD